MGAHDYSYASVLEPCINLTTLFGGAASGKQGAFYPSACKEFADACKMLLSKHFGGCHQAGLIAVVYGNEGGEQCNYGFAGADIALQQAVHLMTAFHILENLADYSFLGACKGKGKSVVNGIEGRSHLWHRESLVAAGLYIFLF